MQKSGAWPLADPVLRPLLPRLSRPRCCRELKRARHIGSFESEEDAARAYDREAIKMLGPDAGLNFRESECEIKGVLGQTIKAKKQLVERKGKLHEVKCGKDS